MTLVAAVGLDGYPVIYGDLLVSGPGRSATPPNIPVADQATDAPAGPEWTLPGLDQKLVLLSDSCVIAWAGNVAAARAVISELRVIASTAPLSMSVIETYLSQLDPAVKDEVSLVGWVRDDGVFHQFWYRADVAESPMFGRISAGGSAATGFVKLASQISEGPVSVQGETLNSLERAIASMLSATSLLLQAELSGQSDLLHHFGDGYEIATFIGDKFAKLSDITVVSWNADVADGQVTLTGPEFILKQDYAGESLLLQTLRMRPGKAPKDPSVVEEDKRVISPFGSPVDAVQAAGVSWPGMEATFTCHVVFVRSPKDFAVVNQVEYSQSRTPGSIRFSLDDGSQRPFAVSQQFCEALLKSIHAGFAHL